MTKDDCLAAVEALERRLLEPGIRSPGHDLDALFGEEFAAFGSSSRVWTRKEIVADLLAQTSSLIEIDSVESRHIC